MSGSDGSTGCALKSRSMSLRSSWSCRRRRSRDGPRSCRADYSDAPRLTFSSSSIKLRVSAAERPEAMRFSCVLTSLANLASAFSPAGVRPSAWVRPSVGESTAHQQAARLQAVQDRHQGRAVDAERARQRHLAQARIAIDQHQQAELARRQRLAGLGKGCGEIGENRRLGAPQDVAQKRGQHAAIQGRAGLADGRAMVRVVNGDCLGSKQIPTALSLHELQGSYLQADKTIEVPTGATILWSALDRASTIRSAASRAIAAPASRISSRAR